MRLLAVAIHCTVTTSGGAVRGAITAIRGAVGFTVAAGGRIVALPVVLLIVATLVPPPLAGRRVVPPAARSLVLVIASVGPPRLPLISNPVPLASWGRGRS